MMETDKKEAEKKGYPFEEDLEQYIKENWIPEEPEKASDEDRASGNISSGQKHRVSIT